MKNHIVLFFLLVICQFSNGQTKNFIDKPYIETKALVDTLVTPDRIYLSILISEKDTRKKQSVEELEQQMAFTLEQLGINLKDQLTLVDLSSNFKKYFLRKQDIEKTKSYELLIYDAQTAGQVIYQLEKVGIAHVDLERTEYSHMESLLLNLKSKAISKAKQQAEAMVLPLNQTLGRAIFVSDLETDYQNILNGEVKGVRALGYSSKKSYDSIPLEFEKIKVQSKVAVKFELN